MPDRLAGKEVLLRKLLVLIPFVLLGGLILVQSRAIRSEVLAAGTGQLSEDHQISTANLLRLALGISEDLLQEALNCLKAGRSPKDCVVPLQWSANRKVDPITDKVDLVVYAVGRSLENGHHIGDAESIDIKFPLLTLRRCYDVLLTFPLRTKEASYSESSSVVTTPAQYRIDKNPHVEIQVKALKAVTTGGVFESFILEEPEAREFLKRIRLGKALHLRLGENLVFVNLIGADQAVGEFLEHCAPVDGSRGEPSQGPD